MGKQYCGINCTQIVVLKENAQKHACIMHHICFMNKHYVYYSYCKAAMANTVSSLGIDNNHPKCITIGQ